ncbi:MAG: hypothetical protein IKP60_12840 [Treponema sp.]|nr:hypothetical protein [Treponema sp.]
MKKMIFLLAAFLCFALSPAFSADQLHVIESPDGSYILVTCLGKLSMEDMYDTLDKSTSKLVESKSPEEYTVEKLSKEQEQLILFALSHYKIEADACYEMSLVSRVDDEQITSTYVLVRIMASEDGRLGWSWWGGLSFGLLE